ncbi:MAG: KH domain-containing protein [Polyangia bacterium]
MAKDHPELQELVKFLAEALVDAPAEVIVEEMEEEGAAVFELTVAEEDLGKVIGKQGRTARALRTILSAAASKVRTRALLEILE